MKKILFGFAFFCAVVLTSCAYHGREESFYNHIGACRFNTENIPVTNQLHEDWLCQLNLNPERWIQTNDRWFLTGEPNLTERSLRHASCDAAISHTSVRVSDRITHVKVNGGFQVQLVSCQHHNNLMILGPNAGARRVAVETNGNTLFVYEIKPPGKKPCLDTSTANVIVRIGIKNLHELTNNGCGFIYGRHIFTNRLVITSTGRGNTNLVGRMNVTHITQANTGHVTVLGAISPCLSIQAYGHGSVNVSGRVGIQSIVNQGGGAVRIIGADSDSLKINTSGTSRTSVIGYTNLKEVIARECSRVYLYWVNACQTHVAVCDNARVGLAGVTDTLHVQLTKNARFWGSYLHAQTGYVQANENAHANITPLHKLFATASGEASIFYLGKPQEVSPFGYDHGVVIAVDSNPGCTSACRLPQGMPDLHRCK